MTLSDYQKYVDEGRIIYLYGVMEEALVNKFREQMREVLDKHPQSDLAVTLTTRGGNVTEGIILHNELKALNTGRTVWMVCQTCVHSMGTYVMLAIPKERRVAFPLTNFYCHRTQFTAGAQTVGYDETHDYYIKEHCAAFENYKRVNEMLASLLTEETAMTGKQVEDLLNNPRQIYIDEALRLGLISKVLK